MPTRSTGCWWPRRPSNRSRWSRRIRSSESTEYPFSGLDLLFAGPADFEHRQERFLRDLHSPHALHAALAFLLLFEQFALARDVAAVALGQHVFAHTGNGF